MRKLCLFRCSLLTIIAFLVSLNDIAKQSEIHTKWQDVKSQQKEKDKEPKGFEKRFYNESSIRILFIKENVVRIQLAPKDKPFRESGLNRYQFIHDTTEVKPKVNIESKSKFSVETPALRVNCNSGTGEVVITDSKSKEILLDQISAVFPGNFSQASFKPSKNEDWIGFGDQTRQRLYQRGSIANCNVTNVKSYIPVPFYMSTKGVGVLVNTTYPISFDMCKTDPNLYSWNDGSGTIDYYVISGNGFKDIIDSYTQLTGRPKLPPEWSFGLWYIGRTQANDYEIVNDALNFRREKIPVDVIGLEPGWMQKNYDYSTTKTWNNEHFPKPDWQKGYPAPFFLKAIRNMGFKMELWLCNDYDLSFEEERRIGKAGSQDSSLVYSVDSSEMPKVIGEPAYSGVVSKKEEPWFRHLEKFVDQGISFFKQDASRQVYAHPGRRWGNGMSDSEMHNLYPLMYARQMYDGFKAKTNLRPVVFTPCGWTGIQAYAGTWTGDTGGSLSSLGGILNTAIVGNSFSTVDMEVSDKEGIHFGYLLPWSVIDSWTYFNMPWVQGKELLEMHKYYSRLRSRLIPYLYSSAKETAQTGWPLIRPLTLDYPKDKNCRENLHQYLLGPDLMIGIFKKEVYFPEGRWKDYWTGEVVEGGQTKTISWPDNRGGALYIRSGGIIPLGPVMQYRGEKPMDTISLYVFPDKKQSVLNFYEDDGISFEYLHGKQTTTRIVTQEIDKESTIKIGLSAGHFKNEVKARTWNITIHEASKPGAVLYNGQRFSANNYSWNESRKELTIQGIIAPATIVVKKLTE